MYNEVNENALTGAFAALGIFAIFALAPILLFLASAL